MRRKWLFVIPLILLVGYALGPHPNEPVYDSTMPIVPSTPAALEKYVEDGERLHKLKAGNEAQIVWANDSPRHKTEYAIVYLHGFSASREEGEPVHRNIARRFNCNLYLSRLAEHGIDSSEAMVNLTADKLWESAKQAVAIGQQLGNKVILMGTSTGGTLALRLAATYPALHSLILLSPNIAIRDDKAWLLNNPWGLQIARAIVQSDYLHSRDQRPIFKRYWYAQYRIEAATALQELIETSMKRPVFEAVKQPLLLLYYYKDQVHQDSVVSVPAMLSMMKELGTPARLKKAINVPKAGDHVIGSYIKSKDLETVEREIGRFMEEVLGLHPNKR